MIYQAWMTPVGKKKYSNKRQTTSLVGYKLTDEGLEHKNERQFPPNVPTFKHNTKVHRLCVSDPPEQEERILVNLPGQREALALNS